MLYFFIFLYVIPWPLQGIKRSISLQGEIHKGNLTLFYMGLICQAFIMLRMGLIYQAHLQDDRI
jgi:hypothetical protein